MHGLLESVKLITAEVDHKLPSFCARKSWIVKRIEWNSAADSVELVAVVNTIREMILVSFVFLVPTFISVLKLCVYTRDRGF